ncbi:hypothetical protein Taro_024232 [Colocasia esculenta]|uniref:Transposase Tnp1/En/Spm-like domain-containing protein n=1 Tax=Colocasia esculenta TaxID=4460 RepID=A0A843VGU9_COLES|nr:hypothetical protein [Colocasia esculenta]
MVSSPVLRSLKRSETNKQNKTKHTFFHCAGSKSFADIYHDKFLKTGATLDRGDLFIRTRIKKAGGPVNDESATMIDKIRDIKLTQQLTTSSSIASVGDAYEQVMGQDRTGRIRGIGTGPTPKSLWGSRSEQKLRQDNESLKEKIEALEERMKKIESRGNNESSASVCHAQKKKDSLAGRRVRILNFSGEVVASGILISDDNDNVVMGKKLGGEYYEVSILIAHDPTASLFIKDADRKNMNDAVGSHIIWFREYCLDVSKAWFSCSDDHHDQNNHPPPHLSGYRSRSELQEVHAGYVPVTPVSGRGVCSSRPPS